MRETLNYSTYISVELKIKNKIENFNFTESNEMGNIYFKDNSQKTLYGYKFINDYFQTGYLNEEKTKEILLDEMKKRKKTDEKIKENKKLSFNILYGNWWNLEDKEVNDNIKLLKEELKKNKYLPIYYKNIIIILLQLEREDFLDEKELLKFIELMEENLKSERTKIDYIDSYRNGNIGIFIEDPKIKEKYDRLTKKLIDIIDKNNEKQEKKTFLEEYEWNEEFINKCSVYNNTFLVSKKFLFYEDVEELIKKLNRVKKPFNIYCLIEGIRKIYSFSNVNEYYKNDIPNLELLISKLRSQIENISKESKTKRMALKELQNKLEDYLNRIKK